MCTPIVGKEVVVEMKPFAVFLFENYSPVAFNSDTAAAVSDNRNMFSSKGVTVKRFGVFSL